MAVAFVAAAARFGSAEDPATNLVPTCSNALTNLGFESGDFAGWTPVDHPMPFVPMANRPAGFTPGFSLFTTAPTEGARVVSHGFDGGTPPPGSVIQLHQDLAVPRNILDLEFDYRAGWDMVTFGGSTMPRVFYVDIEPQGGGVPLQTTTILTAPPMTQNFDTGSQRGTVPLADFVGQTVRVSFEWRIPEAFTGPGHFQLDNVNPLLPVTMALDGNGVFEPGETVSVRPGWLNCSTLAKTTTGTATAFTGPGTPTYTIVDASADYGSIPAAASGDCQAAGGDCYALSITGGTRPSLHWDGTMTEGLSQPGLKQWSMHVGESFADVPTTNPFYRFIETLLHFGITGGCNATDYCPGNATTREQMSVFVLLAKEGAGYQPPACSPPNIFTDVPESSPFCRFIEELFNRGVVGGCGPGPIYCPTAPVTREQMAIFVLRTLDPTIDPPACAPPNLFDDVPESSLFCRFIEELANRGVVGGCSQNPPLYCPTASVTREQMGVFISLTFSLTLYGP